MLQGLDEWLLRGAEEALGEDTKCTCGRDDLESGNLGEPAEHDDGCPIWEEAKIDQIAQDKADQARRTILGEEKPKPKLEFYSLIYGNKL